MSCTPNLNVNVLSALMLTLVPVIRPPVWEIAPCAPKPPVVLMLLIVPLFSVRVRW